MSILNIIKVSAATLCIIAATLASCSRTPGKSSGNMSEEEEMALFESVSGPGSTGDYATVISRADSILGLPQVGDTLKAYIMIERAVALINSGQSGRAIVYADTLADFGYRHDISDARLQGLQIKGILMRRDGHYREAIDLYTEAMDIAIKENNTEQEQVFAECLAVLYADIERNDEARKFSHRSVELSKQLNDTTTLLASMSTLGAILAKQDRFEETIHTLRPYRQQALSLDPLNTVKFLTPLVSSYLALDSLDKAEEAIALEDAAMQGFPENHQQNTIITKAKAELAGKRGDYAEQWRLYQALDSTGRFGQLPSVFLSEKAKCLHRLGRDRDAFGMMADAYATLDSTRRSDVERQLSDLSVRYETFQKQAEIERLTYHRWVLGLIALSCVLLLAVIVVISAVVIRKKRRVARQRMQEEYLRGLEQERTRIANELHDDIAGSITGLQWEMLLLPLEKTAERLSEIGHRVRTLSHEMMPPEFSQISLTALIQDMAARFNASHTSHRITLTDEGSFDWDSLPADKCHELYRMIQEAVNNAVKHGEAGEIRITLDGDDCFRLCISNPCPEDTKVSGLRTMRTRAAVIGADLDVSADKKQFKLSITRHS